MLVSIASGPGTILDVGYNELPVAITDISATCHMPDVIEAPYRPAMLGEGTSPHEGGGLRPLAERRWSEVPAFAGTHKRIKCQ